MEFRFLLSDTVGFIRKLPHHLVESFKSTLSESKEADILIHVVDASHPQFEDQIENVKETLRSLDIQDRTVITVFNKSDKLSEEEKQNLEKSWLIQDNMPAVMISSKNKDNLDQLRKIITEELVNKYQKKSHNGQHHFLRNYQYYQMEDEMLG